MTSKLGRVYQLSGPRVLSRRLCNHTISHGRSRLSGPMSKNNGDRAIHVSGMSSNHDMVPGSDRMAELSGLLLLIYIRLHCEIHSPPQPSRRPERVPCSHPWLPLTGIGDVKAVPVDYPRGSHTIGPEADERARACPYSHQSPRLPTTKKQGTILVWNTRRNSRCVVAPGIFGSWEGDAPGATSSSFNVPLPPGFNFSSTGRFDSCVRHLPVIVEINDKRDPALQ